MTAWLAFVDEIERSIVARGLSATDALVALLIGQELITQGMLTTAASLGATATIEQRIDELRVKAREFARDRVAAYLEQMEKENN